jgi:hypothetical protein
VYFTKRNDLGGPGDVRWVCLSFYTVQLKHKLWVLSFWHNTQPNEDGLHKQSMVEMCASLGCLYSSI